MKEKEPVAIQNEDPVLESWVKREWCPFSEAQAYYLLANMPLNMKERISEIPITVKTRTVAIIGANPGQACGITMRVNTGIAETNGPSILKVVKEITKIPSIGCLTGTTPPPQEGSMILRDREPNSINPGTPAEKIMTTDLMDIDHRMHKPLGLNGPGGNPYS